MSQRILSQTNIPLVLTSFLLTNLILCSKVEHILLWIHIAIVVSTLKYHLQLHLLKELYDRVNVNLIRSCITNFPWEQHLNSNPDISWQLKILFLNIMSNFVPNKIIKGVPGDPPWISRSLKNILNRQSIV